MTSKPMERFMPLDVKSWQYTAWALIESNPWEMVIMFLIILNTFVMLVEVTKLLVYKYITFKINKRGAH